MASRGEQEATEPRHGHPPVSTLQRSPAERGAADRSDMNGNSMSRVSSDHRSVSGPSGEHYKPELRQVVLWLQQRPSTHHDTADRIEFFLPLEQYLQFQKLVQCGEFADEKLKYDYSCDRETLAIKMASRRHQVLTEHLSGSLKTFIDKAKQHRDPAIAAFASTLIPIGSSPLYYPSRNGRGKTKRQPDSSVLSRNNPKYPTLIGEVANSQTTEGVENLAKEYIELSKGNIRTVIGIDLDYPMEKGAVRISVWRAQFGEDGKFEGVACDSNVEIRGQDGLKSHARVALSLSLEDFAPVGEVAKYPALQSVTLTVSTDDLYEIVEVADALENAQET